MYVACAGLIVSSEQLNHKFFNWLKNSINQFRKCQFLIKTKNLFTFIYLFTISGRHLNFVISALIEIASYILAYFALSSFLGRRYSMISYQYLNAIFCLSIGLLTFVEGDSEWKKWLIIVCALVGKGLAVSGFGGMFIYGSELFPTATRASALGLCGFFARVGSLIAPQIILLVRLSSHAHQKHLCLILPTLLLGGKDTSYCSNGNHVNRPIYWRNSNLLCS